jgi:hypothetical protein
MEIAGSAAAGADGEFAPQMRLGARRERCHLLVPYMDPLDLALLSDCIGETVQAVADNAVDALDASRGKGFRGLIGNLFCHLFSLDFKV